MGLLLLMLSSGTLRAQSGSGQPWPAWETDRNWRSITSSADGSKLAAVVSGGQIYTSTDSGVTWTAQNSGSRPWASITSSADGSKLAAVMDGGQIYTSTDYGVTWTAQASGSRIWRSITSSADGSKLAAVVEGGLIYTSTDSGVTWTGQDSGSRPWASITSSADGSKLAAVDQSGPSFSGGQIYTSADSGVTWTAQNSGSRYWRSIASSADGSKLAAVMDGGQIYTSTDSGVTWTEQNSGIRYWGSIASSEDGSKLAAVDQYGSSFLGGKIYTSTDSGVTWTEQNSGIRRWASIASSADGSKLAAVDSANGQIYTSPMPISLTVTVTSVSPTSGSTAGGAAVTITGTGLTGATHVTIGGVVATNLTVVNATTIICTTPEGTPGTASVLVITSGGTNAENSLYTYSGYRPGESWTAQDSGSRPWASITSSADGSKLAAVVEGGQIYTSTDSGVTWTEQNSGSRYWFSITSSADGSKLAAVDGLGPNFAGGKIYTSTDSGVTWTEQNSGSRRWRSITSSADGSKLAAVDQYGPSSSGGQIYTSADSGVTWTAQNSGSRYWRSIASSADGSKLAAVVEGGLIYTSTDSGVTWTEQNSGSRNWASITSSADGSKLAAVDPYGPNFEGGKIYTSTDSGVTWTEQNSGSRNWGSIASSADGSKLAAVVSYNGRVVTSIDSGVTWKAMNSGKRYWSSITSSADGGKLAAVAYNSQIYTSAFALTATSPTVTSVSPASGSTAGGTSVTITGTDLTGATGVTIGGAAATNVSVVNATTITCTTPAGTAGTASVVVTTAGGSNAANTLFTYLVQLVEIVVHDGSHSLAPELSDGQVTQVNFGSTAPNVVSVRNFLVRNTGNDDLTISSITVPSGYSTNGAPATLAPNASYDFQVALDASTAATYSGNVVINSNDLNEAAFDFPVTGTVVASGSAPLVNVDSDIAVRGSQGSSVLGGPVGSKLYSFVGSPALNSSGVSASAVQILQNNRLRAGMMLGQPPILIALDNQAAPSLPGVTHFNFGPPVINEAGDIAFIGEVRGAGITPNVNSRCLFSNASDGTLKLVARTGTNVGLGSNLMTIGNFSIGGDLVIFLGTLADKSSVLFGWDANTNLRPLIRTGLGLFANGVTKTVRSFSILETSNTSSGHGKEISVAPTGESVVTFSVVFTDGTSGVVIGSFDGSSDSGFGLAYAASQQLVDTYAAPGVLPLAKWNTFNSPGFDNTGTYYGFISLMAANKLAGVSRTNDLGVFVDTAPGIVTLQLRENDAAPGTAAGVVFSDFSDLVLGGGDYEFLVNGAVRGTGVTVNVNSTGLWTQHATNGLQMVARQGSEAPGVAGSQFSKFNQIALPGAAQPIFQATMKTGVGGVTTANDTGLWVVNESGAVKLAVREGDTLNVGGTPRTVTAITALVNGTSTGGAVGRRVFLADGQLTLLLTFTGGVQANAKVVVP